MPLTGDNDYLIENHLKGVPVKKILISLAFLFIAVPVSSQTFPMDRWLDKVDLIIKDGKIQSSFSFTNAFGSKSVRINIGGYDQTSRVLYLNLRFYEYDEKTKILKSSSCLIDAFIPNRVKLANYALLNDILDVAIFVDGVRTRPKTDEIEKIIIVYPNKIDNNAKVTKWRAYEYNTQMNKTGSGLKADIMAAPHIVDSIPEY